MTRIGDSTILVSSEQVNAFRLSRHHLSTQPTSVPFTAIASDIGGAQAQVLSAAQLSIWTRWREGKAQDLDAAIWKAKTLVRAKCMRGTLFLLPSEDLSVFVRGCSRRAAYNLDWALDKVSSKQQFEKLLEVVRECLDKPRTRKQLSELLRSRGYKIKLKAGGGWGNQRPVPFVEVGGTSFSLGMILHALGAREVLCLGPSAGAESTFVRADRWLPNWVDVSQEKAEDELLARYLRSFGPATLADFTLWLGMYARDSKAIWSRNVEKLAHVEVDRVKMAILEQDLQELDSTKAAQPSIRLLPNFDSFLLGHKSHRNIVDEVNHKMIYRSAGWISPVLLINGRAAGVWSYAQNKSALEVRIMPFSKIQDRIVSQIKAEAAELGKFLESPSVKTTIA